MRRAATVIFYAPVAQLDRALDSDSKGRTFESCRAYHVGASFISLAPTFFKKSERTHSAAPPFQAANAPLVCGLMRWGFGLVHLFRQHSSTKKVPTKVVTSLLGSAHFIRSTLRRFQCSGSAKPPLRNLFCGAKRFTAHKRRRPEGRFCRLSVPLAFDLV